MQGWVWSAPEKDEDQEHLGLDSQERGELQLPSPCEGARLSQHDVDERRLTE